MHDLLARQLRECFGAEAADPRLERFVTLVNAAYHQAEDDRLLLERSVELKSSELLAQNRALQRDLESIQRLELELHQAEKLRAVGQLAAGIAHEINTPIQFIGDSLHFMREAFFDFVRLSQRASELCAALGCGAPTAALLDSLRTMADEVELKYLLEEVPRAFERVTDGLDRVRKIVFAMKEFGRTDQREKTLADVNQGIVSTLTVARNEFKYVADVDADLGALPPIPCYIGELNQVFLNLLINAAHAVAARFEGSKQRGSICIRTSIEGEHAVVSLSDNGCGIPRSNYGRIFEPFFTTKPLGQGTGQGLAVSRSIVVDKHGGTLTFESEEGKGTTFVVRLPLHDKRLPGPSEPVNSSGVLRISPMSAGESPD
jgi:two-component system, NtrC family, sensor kinase